MGAVFLLEKQLKRVCGKRFLESATDPPGTIGLLSGVDDTKRKGSLRLITSKAKQERNLGTDVQGCGQRQAYARLR